MSSKQRYHQRLEAGLCVTCGLPTDRVPRCTNCVKLYIDTTRKLKEKKLAHGLCIQGKCSLPVVPGKKMCKKHLEHNLQRVQERRHRHMNSGLCPCGRERDSTYQECKLCRDRARASHSKSAMEMKLLVFRHYSNLQVPKCNCCGEDILDMLALDHVGEGGNRHRDLVTNGRGSEPFYRWLVKQGLPSGYQVLCHNCNFAKWKNGGVCPHQKVKPNEDYGGSTLSAEGRRKDN